jgi:hypothetical protein
MMMIMLGLSVFAEELKTKINNKAKQVYNNFIG